MSHWNYRVLKTEYQSGETIEIQYALHECYYRGNSEIPYMWTPELKAIYCCEDVDQLRESLGWQLLALDKAVLEVYTDKKGNKKLRVVK